MDMQGFDFSKIVDYDDAGDVISNQGARVPRGGNDIDSDTGFDVDMIDFEDDADVDVSDDSDMSWLTDGEEAEDAAKALANTTKDFETSFSSLPDEYEIVFGDTKVSKKDLAEVVTARAEITKTREALNSFVSGIVNKEDVVQTVLTVAKTETELQLDRVNEILDNPDDYHGDLKAVIAAKRTLTARMKDLEVKGTEARAAIESQREQAAALAIQNTAKQVTGGMDTLRSVADFAKSRGIGHEILMNHISPELVAMLQDAQRYQVAMEKNKSRVNGVAKKKVPTSNATARKTSEARAAANKKTQILNKIKAGQYVDPADSFLLIQD